MKCIQLSRGQVAIVDDEDHSELAQWRWTYSKRGYAVRTAQPCDHWHAKTMSMHQWIMKAKKGDIVDHKNCQGLDNRKENLRLATNAQNQQNRRCCVTNKLGVKGVCKFRNGYKGSIKFKGKHIQGYFKTIEEAKAFHDKVAMEHFGEFARLN